MTSEPLRPASVHATHGAEWKYSSANASPTSRHVFCRPASRSSSDSSSTPGRQELQLAAGPTEQPLRLRGRADPVERAVVQFVEAVLGKPQRVEHRSREQPVQQHEFDDAAGVEHAAVGAQIGVVRARRAQHRHPCRRRSAVTDAGQQQPHRHVDAFDRPAEHHEPVAVVARQRRVGQPGEHRRAALDEGQELMRAQDVWRPARVRPTRCTWC